LEGNGRMNKSEMIEKIANFENNGDLNSWSGHYTIDSETDIDSIVYEIQSELEDIKENLVEVEKITIKRIKELERMPYHELEEIGEKLGLWNLTVKQKRLC
jgi:hypothetical protein